MTNDPRSLRGSAAIAGVATFGCGETPGFTDLELLARSARAAVADAGLKMSDIDGLCTASASSTMWGLPVVEYLGLNPRYIDTTMLGGSSFIAHLLPAMRGDPLGPMQSGAGLLRQRAAQRGLRPARDRRRPALPGPAAL